MNKLNQYQINAIEFFNQHADHFVEWLLKETEGSTVTIDFLKHGVAFLDKEIKAEMGLYKRQPYTVGRYDYLSDILIEVNLTHNSKEFADALTRRIATVFAAKTPAN